jgi:HEAT repeats
MLKHLKLAGQKSVYRHLSKSTRHLSKTIRYLIRNAGDWRTRYSAIELLDQSTRSLLVLQSCARYDVHSDLRYLAVQILSTSPSWQNNFITLVALIAATQDPHRDVQYLAICGLVENKNWKNHPAARQCLQQIVESDVGWEVKFVAIEALQDW